MSFKEIYRSTVRINKNKFLFPHAPISDYAFRQLSFFLTPFFIIGHFSPNTISVFGLLIGLISAGLIAFGSNNLFPLGILLYFFGIIVDYCDGNVARITQRSTFFGRFIDGVIDIILLCAIRLALVSVVLYKIQNEGLMWIGITCAVLTPFHHLYFDRYSAFARWINQETKTNIKPYIKSHIFPRANNILLDLQFLCLLLMSLMIENNNFIYLCSLYFLINITMGVFYIIIHTIYSYNNMKVSASEHR